MIAVVGEGHWSRFAQGLKVAALGLLVTACSAVDGAQEPVPAATSVQAEDTGLHPITGLEVRPVTVVSSDTRHVFKTEMALSPQAQQRGLMFRETLADDEAMLFPNEIPQTRSFWMKNTPIALDIIFIAPDRRIANIETAVPYSLESVPSAGDVIGVFEIRGGLAGELGIAPGDTVEWELP